MRILLINPLWTSKEILPTNLAELAGYVRANGYEDITIVDLNYELKEEKNPDKWIRLSGNIASAREPEIIGITCNTIHVPFVAEFCRAIKKKCKVPLVLGGIHPTFRPERMFDLTGADYIVRGEGEETFLDLLNHLKYGENIERLAGLSFRKKGEIRNNPLRPLIRDLSRLPFPAYDLLLSNRKRMQKNAPFYVSASRGCGFKCIFCSASKMWRYQRRKPITRVLDEIEYLKTRLECDFFDFADDCLTLNKKWVYGLLEGLEPLNVTWSCLCRIDTLDPDLIKAMKNAGCRAIYHGLESGSTRIRNDILNKKLPAHMTNDNIVEVVEEEIRHGIKPYCSFMAGIPTETRAEMEETVQLGQELKKRGAVTQFWIMTPYPDIKAVQIYQDKLVRLNRWEIAEQSDINVHNQFYLYHKFYHKYLDENPDLQMFLPEMPVADFFNLYLEGKAKLEPSFMRNSLGSYIKEKKSGRWLQTIKERIRLNSLGSGSIGAHLLVSLESPFSGLNEVAESVVETRPRHCLVSIKIEKRDARAGLTRDIFDFLILLRNAQIHCSLTRPFPYSQDARLLNLIKMPRNCRECLELFRVGANGRIILCTGRQLFLEPYAENRFQIYGIFLELAKFEERRKDLCILFPDPDQIKILGDRQEKARTYKGLAFKYYFNKEYSSAVEFSRKARRAGYTEWEADYLLGLSLKNMGDDHAALKELRKAEKKNPCKSDINLAIVSCLKKINDLDALFIEAGKAARKRNLSQALLSKKVEEMTFRCLTVQKGLQASIKNKEVADR